MPENAWTQRLVIALLFLLSGFTGLVYEVLWLKELGLVFGATTQSAAAALSAFFLGLAAGGHFWGRRAAGLRNPLRAYAYLEFAIAFSALGYFVLLDIYHGVYEPLYMALGGRPAALTAAKFALAVAVLFPPAFFMGGTLPVMGQYLVRGAAQLGRTGSFLYSINTLGAALGAFSAGFFLPAALGFNRSYWLAISVNVAIGLAALALARREPERQETVAPERSRRKTRAAAAEAPLSNGMLWTLAFLSGFLTLGLEVLWTRMFSQVLQNSVYTFSAVLVIFLVVLSLGAALANRLCRLERPPEQVLSALLALAGLAVMLTPFAFMEVTRGMRYLGVDEPWPQYLRTVFSSTGLVLAVPGVLIGSIFPYLLRLAQGTGTPGAVIGRLAALNTLGAVAGSAAAGFVLLGTVGLWGSSRLFALAYLVLALLVTTGAASRSLVLRGAPVAGLVLLFTIFDTAQLPVLRVASRDERVLGVWQGSHGVVAVVERPSGLRIKVNNYYRLGGTASRDHERNQALIPLMTHPHPDEVFFLGMGTGITAGASLAMPVRRVVVCELVPEVIHAGARFFNEYAGGLFTDPRVEILPTDGRNHLFGSRAKYDAVISDLFIPWKEGAGNLYSLEHFRAVSRRLKKGGLFAQWLPLYQVSEEEFYLIARTMLEVFPEIVVWRGDFYPERPILALIASNEPLVLDPRMLVARGRAMAGNPRLPPYAVEAVTLPFYMGNLGRSRGVIPPGTVNTDNNRAIEYGSPITHRSARSDEDSWFNGQALERFAVRLLERTPPEEDPYIEQLNGEQRGYIEAGLSYYKGAVASRRGDSEAAKRHLAAFHERIPIEFRPDTDDAEPATDFGE